MGYCERDGHRRVALWLLFTNPNTFTVANCQLIQFRKGYFAVKHFVA